MIINKAQDHPILECLGCGMEVNQANVVGQGATRPPKEGDLSICAFCSNLMAYTANGGFRALEPDEIQEIFSDERIMSYLKEIAELRKKLDNKDFISMLQRAGHVQN